jgi:hypothetical protein
MPQRTNAAAQRAAAPVCLRSACAACVRACAQRFCKWGRGVAATACGCVWTCACASCVQLFHECERNIAVIGGSKGGTADRQAFTRACAQTRARTTHARAQAPRTSAAHKHRAYTRAYAPAHTHARTHAHARTGEGDAREHPAVPRHAGLSAWAAPYRRPHPTVGRTLPWATPCHGPHPTVGHTLPWATPCHGPQPASPPRTSPQYSTPEYRTVLARAAARASARRRSTRAGAARRRQSFEYSRVLPRRGVAHLAAVGALVAVPAGAEGVRAAAAGIRAAPPGLEYARRLCPKNAYPCP